MLSDFCENMLELLKDMEQRFYSLNAKQIETFLQAFRRVKDNICSELLQTKKDYQALKSLIDNNVQLIKLEKELKFFRDECLALNQINSNFKQEKTQLLSHLENLKQENYELKQLIIKQEKSKKENQIDLVNNLVAKQFLTPNTSYTSRPRTKFAVDRSLDKSVEKSGEIKIVQQVPQGRQPKIMRRCQTPILGTMSRMDDNELKALFRECVEHMQQEIKLRKLKQSKNKNVDELERNSNQENKLSEYKAEHIRITKFDQKQIVESIRFFNNPRFLKIVQHKIFEEKCCDNFDCIFNLQKPNIQEKEESINYLEQLQQEHEQQLDSKSVKQQLSTYKPEWNQQDKNFFTYNAKNVNQKKLEYQHCLASVKFIEKELLSVPKKDRAKIQKMQKQSQNIQGKIRALSQIFQNDNSNF